MDLQAEIECAGNPRDMGRAQGTACSADVRSWLRAQGFAAERRHRFSLRAYTSGPVLGAGVGREIVRHFTHLSERIDGLARHAAVPLDSLAGLHVRAARSNVLSAGEGTPVALAMRRGAVEADVELACSLPRPASNAPGFLLRRSRPAVGFESVELTLPWLVSSLAGVNSAGLAVAFVSRPSAADAAGRSKPAAPSILLVQDCLQRFEQIEAAIDWCLNRPVAGDGVIVLADARQEMASVHVERGERRVSWPKDGVVLHAAGTEAEALLQKREEIDALWSRVPLVPGPLREALGADATRVVLEPALRKLGVVDASGARPPIVIQG